MQALKEKDRSPTSDSHMWEPTGRPPDKPVVLTAIRVAVPRYTAEGFVVLKGSKGRIENVASIQGTSNVQIRESLVKDGPARLLVRLLPRPSLPQP